MSFYPSCGMCEPICQPAHCRLNRGRSFDQGGKSQGQGNTGSSYASTQSTGYAAQGNQSGYAEHKKQVYGPQQIQGGYSQ